MFGKTSSHFAPQPNYRFEVTEMQLYADPGDADQTNGIESRYIVQECDMNKFEVGRDAEWWKDIAKEV